MPPNHGCLGCYPPLHTTLPINQFYHPFSPYLTRLPWRADVLARQERILAHLTAQYQLPSFDFPDVLFQAEMLNIVFLPREFHPAADTFDERFVFVGPSIYPRDDAADFPLHQLLDVSPVLYVSLGSIWNKYPLFFDACIHAFGSQPQLVVMAIGDDIDRKVFGPLPDNIRMYSSVPQLDVLQHANAFVTHGGPNSVMEAMYYGVPIVAIPIIFDQRVAAGRVAELQLGTTFERFANVTAHTLREAVILVKEHPQVRANVQRMRHAIVKAGGYPRAVDAIQRLIKEVCA